MTYEQDLALIAGYNDWVIQRKRELSDLTPEAYLQDRMKGDAADRLIKAIEHIETFGEWKEPTGEYEGQSIIPDDMRKLELILRGHF